MKKPLIAGLAGLAVVLFASVAWAELLIDVGNHPLLPGTAGQTITIDITGGDAVGGGTIFLQVADGGPEAIPYLPPGTIVGIDGPDITAVDILTGTIFDGNNLGDFGGTVVPQAWQSLTYTQAGTAVDGDGLLATVTLDTTGFTSGSWDLSMGSLLGQTEFGGVPLRITPGTIFIPTDGEIIPEPASCVLLLLGTATLLLWHRRRAPSA